MERVTTEVIINGNAKEIYILLKNIEEFVSFMPDVKHIDIVERYDNTSTSNWHTEIDGVPFLWTEREIYNDTTLSMRYELIKGDLKRFEGEWRILEQPNHTVLLMLYVDYEVGIPEIEDILGPVIKEKIKDNSYMMLTAIKEKIEARSIEAEVC